MSADIQPLTGISDGTHLNRAGWRGALIWLGYWRGMALITFVSIAASLALTAAFVLPLEAAQIEAHTAMMIAFAVPAIVAPIASHLLLTVLHELDVAQRALIELANRDGLTHTYTRRFFVEQFALNVARASRTGEPMSLLMLDADYFKAVNDQHGHAAGDTVLQAIAGVCESLLRPYDILARYGGEEFAVLLPNTTPAGACAVAERLRSAVEALRIEALPGISIGVTVSVGVSALHAPTDNAKQLMERADIALFAAKNAGRNRWVFKGESEAQNPAPLHFRVNAQAAEAVSEREATPAW